MLVKELCSRLWTRFSRAQGQRPHASALGQAESIEKVGGGDASSSEGHRHLSLERLM